MASHRAARLQLLGAAALFSTGGAAIKACALSVWEIAGYRSGIAALAFLAMVPAARRRWGRRELTVGAAYAATMILYVLANKLTTAANAIFLQSTAPVWILLLAPWLLHEGITRRDLFFLGVVGTGLACFFVDEQEPLGTASNPLAGNLLALASGVGWALTVVGIRWLGTGSASGSSPVGAIVAGNALAFSACLVPIALAGPPAQAAVVRAPDWLVLVYLGVFQIALAYVLVTTALRQLQAFEASVLLLVEPVLNPVWAFLIHGERPGTFAVAGGGLILAATAVKTWSEGSALTETVVPVDRSPRCPP